MPSWSVYPWAGDHEDAIGTPAHAVNHTCIRNHFIRLICYSAGTGPHARYHFHEVAFFHSSLKVLRIKNGPLEPIPHPHPVDQPIPETLSKRHDMDTLARNARAVPVDSLQSSGITNRLPHGVDPEGFVLEKSVVLLRRVSLIAQQQQLLLGIILQSRRECLREDRTQGAISLEAVGRQVRQGPPCGDLDHTKTFNSQNQFTVVQR